MSSVDGARTLQYSSDEVFASICSPCHYTGNEKEATYFCEDCKENLCQNCADSHKGLRISRHHKISVLKNPLPKTKPTPVISCSVFCGCSINLEVTVYCEDHCDAFCLSCKTLKHGKCATVDISQKCESCTATKLNIVAEKARALKEETDSFLKERSVDLQKLAALKAKCKNDIKTFRKELTFTLDLLEQNTLQELEKLELQLRQDIERHLSSFTTTKQMVEADEKLLNDALKSSEKINLFAVDVKISNRLKDYERLLHDTRLEIKPPTLSFQRHEELIELQTKVKDLGTLMCAKSRQLSFSDIKIVSSSQADIKMGSGEKTPYISGCAFLPNGQVILCDRSNKSVIILSTAFTVSEVLQLEPLPWGVSVLSNSKAIISLPDRQQIQFLQTAPKLKTEHTIQLDKQCWGVEVAGEDIYVTCHKYGKHGEVRVLDLAGHCKRRLGLGQAGNFMFESPSNLILSANATTLYVSDREKNKVTCLKTDGSILNEYHDTDLNWPRGLCVDGDDNIIVCSEKSNETHVVTADRIKNRKLLSSKDGISRPCSVAYYNGTLIVGCRDNIKLFVYKVE